MAAEREAFRGPSSTSIVRSRIDVILGVFLNNKWKEKVLQGAFKSAGVFSLGFEEELRGTKHGFFPNTEFSV